MRIYHTRSNHDNEIETNPGGFAWVQTAQNKAEGPQADPKPVQQPEFGAESHRKDHSPEGNRREERRVDIMMLFGRAS
jgi:hypothetical protein